LFAMVSFASGVQLFFLGVLGEYVSLIFDEVKDRPLYLLDRRYRRRAGTRRDHDCDASLIGSSLSGYGDLAFSNETQSK
jgi:hypothetical protein